MDKSEDLQTPKRRTESACGGFLYPHIFQFRFGAKDTRHKGDGYYNHRFFHTKNHSFHPYGRREKEKRRPTEAEEKSLHTK